MKKIKITERQADMLKNVDKPKVLKITKEQYNRILEMENLKEIDLAETDINDLLIVKDNEEYILVNKNNKVIEAKIGPAKYINNQKMLCDRAMSTFNELFENRGMFENVYRGGEENIIGPLTGCKIGVSEDSLKTHVDNRMVKAAPATERPQLTRELKKANPYKINEMYEDFIRELYGLNESDPVMGESKYSKLRKLMEINGFIKGNRIVKEKFNNNKERVKEVITAGLNEMCNGNSVYRAMEAIEEALDLSKDMEQNDLYKGLVDQWFKKYFNQTVYNEYERGNFKLAYQFTKGVSKEKAAAAKIQRDMYQSEDTEREDALKHLAKSEQQQKIELEKGDGKEMDEHNFKHGDYVGHSEPKSGIKKVYDVLIKIDSDLALMKKNGELYVFRVPDEEEFHNTDYVSVPGEAEHSEDGWSTVYNYDDVDVDEEAIELYVNDNINGLRIGQGYDAYDSGDFDVVKVDDDIRAELLSLSNYIARNNPKKAEELKKILTMNEVSSMVSTGVGVKAPIGKLGDVPVSRRFQPTEIDLDEVTDSSSNAIYDLPMGRGSKDKAFWTAGNKENKHLEEGVNEQRYVVEMDFYIWANDDDHAKQVAQEMAQEMDSKYDNQPRVQKLFKQPFGTLGSTEVPLNEDSHSETQWKGGSFVNVKEKCKKFPYCDEGPGAIEIKKTKKAIISNDHIVQEIAKKTGRTIEEVKKIISNFK